MPLYEYECTACHRRTEKIQKFSDAELTVCPFCNGPLERTLTAPAVHFAGGGWYKDLYSSAKPPAAAGDAKPGESQPADSKQGESKQSGSDGAASSGGGGSDSSAAPAAAPASPAPAPSVSAAPAAGGSKGGS